MDVAAGVRQSIIDRVLAEHKLGPQLRTRIERLLDGVEQEDRLRCCHSGCFVCVDELKQVLAEVRQRLLPTSA